MNKGTLGPILQIIQNRLIGLGDVFFDVVHFQRSYQICGSFPSAFKFAGLVQIVHNRRRGEPFFSHRDRSVVRSRRLGINGFFFACFNRLLANQASDFADQGGDHSRKPNDPFRRSLALGQRHFDSILVSEQVLSKGAVESFHDRLVPVNIHPAALNVSFVFFHLFGDTTHELAPRIHLQKL